MPIVQCMFGWCDYIGEGETPMEQWNDVVEHEKECLYGKDTTN